MKVVCEIWKRLELIWWWKKMEDSDIYLWQTVLQNRQQNLDYPLYVPYGAMSPVLAAEPKGILILDVPINLFSDESYVNVLIFEIVN